MRTAAHLAGAALIFGVARAQINSTGDEVAPMAGDEFDITLGIQLTSCTPGFLPSALEMFGANTGGAEPGNCSCPNVGVGQFSFVEIRSALPVTLWGVRLFGKNDGAAFGFRHALGAFRLWADTDDDGDFETLLVNADVCVDYSVEPENLTPDSDRLQLLSSFAPTQSASWRMEFVQGTGIGSDDGVRIIEIDAIRSLCQSPVAYCTSGTTSGGCRASIAGFGTASATAPSGFMLTVCGAEPLKQGMLFYGVDNAGFTPTPWANGSTSFLCVKGPMQRMLAQNTGGNWGQCDGELAVDWNAFRAANPGALGAPFDAGRNINAQAWFRDPPAAKTTSLSNGLSFTLCP